MVLATKNIRKKYQCVFSNNRRAYQHESNKATNTWSGSGLQMKKGQILEDIEAEFH